MDETDRMIIVAGVLFVDPSEREGYLSGCHDVIVQARRAPGCVDFHLSADAIEPGRINVYEQWESIEDVERFRGDGMPDEQAAIVTGARVHQHVVASSELL